MNSVNFLKNVERRDFLKILSLTGIGSLIYSKDAIASVLSPSATSKVVVITNNSATDSVNHTVNSEAVKIMVNDGIKSYTGISDVGNAWKSIFPDITASSVIGLKVNTLFNTKNVGTHPQVAYAVADGLVQMDFEGIKFPANNIIIFDLGSNYLADQGYTLNTTLTGVRCFPSSAYSSEIYNVSGVNLKISTIITQQINFLINIAQLKQHSMSGLSLCLKNHFGSINQPWACHNNNCDPFIPGIAALAPIKNKQKFCIIDALFGITSGGPSGAVTCAPNKIIMGQDIVAVDCIGRDLLKDQGTSQSSINQATHINTAATTYSLGNNNASNISTVDITSPVTGPTGIMEEAENSNRLMQNSPNPFNNETIITFYLHSGEHVQLRIIDYTGKTINILVNKKLESGAHRIKWNGQSASGQVVPAGIYICELKTILYNKSIIIQKVK